MMNREVNTPMGAKIKVTDAPEHLGTGVMLTIRMQDPTDRRSAEVYLDIATATALSDLLRGY